MNDLTNDLTRRQCPAKLGEILINDGYLNEKQLNEAILIQSKSQKLLGQIITDLRYLNEDIIIKAVSKQLGIDYIQAMPDDFAVSFDFLSKEYCTVNNCLVLKKIDSLNKSNTSPNPPQIILLIVNIFSTNIYKDLSALTNITKIYIATSEFILKNLGYLIEEQTDPEKYLKNLIDMAASKGASDIHLNPIDRETVFCHMVINGNLEKLNPISLTFFNQLKNIIKNKGGFTNNTNPKDTLSMMFEIGQIQIRTEFYPERVKNLTENQHKITLRLLGLNKRLLNLTDLGFDSATVELMSKIMLYNSGLVLISGPTSAGKSTTVFAIIKMIAEQMDRYIYTIEDPVEINLSNSNIAQGEINDIITYEKSIKSILRSAPNVIVIGEIRDKEVAKQAIIAAETGHLVFATVHANSSLGIVRRLENLGIDKNILLDSVRILMSQKLYNELCHECKEYKNIRDYPERYIKDNLIMGALRKSEAVNSDFKVYDKGHKQCKTCGGTGFIQRKAVIEIIDVTDGIRLSLLKENSIFNIERSINYRTLKQKAYELLISGSIDISQYYKIGY
jgi:type IV pilus assembly protein PilB